MYKNRAVVIVKHVEHVGKFTYQGQLLNVDERTHCIQLLNNNATMLNN